MPDLRAALIGALPGATAYGDTVDRLLPVVEEYARRYAAEALQATAHAWAWGGWADTPRRADRVADRIGAAQYVAEWLRARADDLRKGTA